MFQKPNVFQVRKICSSSSELNGKSSSEGDLSQDNSGASGSYFPRSTLHKRTKAKRKNNKAVGASGELGKHKTGMQSYKTTILKFRSFSIIGYKD